MKRKSIPVQGKNTFSRAHKPPEAVLTHAVRLASLSYGIGKPICLELSDETGTYAAVVAVTQSDHLAQLLELMESWNTPPQPNL